MRFPGLVYSLFVAVLVVCTVSKEAMGQEASSQLLRSLVASCNSIRLEDNEQNRIVGQAVLSDIELLIRRQEKNYTVDQLQDQLVSQALPCARFVVGEDAVYLTEFGRFLTKGEVAVERERVRIEALASENALQAEQERRRRKLELQMAIKSACEELYYSDRVGALTNSTCIEMFSAHGIPE